MTQETAPQTTETSPINEADYQKLTAFNTVPESGSIKKAMAEAGARSADLWKVDPFKLQTLPDFNGRLDQVAFRAHVETLKESMRKNGYYQDQPLSGFVGIDAEGKQSIFVTEGHHRLTAIRELIEQEGFVVNPQAKNNDISFLPKAGKYTMADITIAAWKSNNEKRQHTVLETAIYVLRLRETDKLESFQIAERMNLSKPYVETLLTLARSPLEIRNLVQSGKVSASIAIDTIRKKGDDAQAVLTTAVESAEKRAEQAAAKKPQAKVKETINAPEVKPTVATANPETEKQPSNVTVTTVNVAKPKPTQVKVRRADISPEEKLLKLQQELAPRLFTEILRLEKAGLIKGDLSPELEKILFLVENVDQRG